MPFPEKPRYPQCLLGLYSPIPQQGKSTVAGYFQECLSDFTPGGLKAHLLSFATPIKYAAHAFLGAIGLTEEEATRAVFKEKDRTIPPFSVTPMEVMLDLETLVGRTRFGPDVWVNRTMRDVNRSMALGHSVIVDDVRMPNEAHAILSAGGSLIRVVRCGIDEDTTKVYPRDHEGGEGLLEGLEMFRIYNSGKRPALIRATMSALNTLFPIRR